MNNILEFQDGYKAVINYDPELEMFRGEFVGINGGADFYATDIAGLKKEGAISLNVFLDMCKEKDIAPKRKDGKFALRLDPELYHQVCAVAKASNMSINSFIEDNLRKTLHAK